MGRLRGAIGFLLAIGAMVALGACGSSSSSSSPSSSGSSKGLKVGFIYVSPLPGSAWSLAWDRARQDLVQKFGAQATVVQPIPETPVVVGTMQDLIRRGDKMIFATAIGYQPFVVQVAQQNPNVDFVVTGPWLQKQPRPKNVASVYGNLWEIRYLTGIVAASMSKKKQLGFVSAFSLPSVVSGINGFEAGARSVDPSIKTKVVLTNNWYNPPQSTQAAEALATSGADVIGKHMDDIGACLGAKAASVWCIGSEANTSAQTPTTYLTGSVYNWNSYAEQKYEQALHGGFTNDEFNGDLADGLISLGPINPKVPASVVSKVMAAESSLKAGKLIVFKGPIYDNTGKLVLPSGQAWSTPAQVYTHMTFYEQGIIGTVQK
ncbi:MAG: BMP family ABC transporter substrate-binding protein [Actinomycetota bacterium]|nr:BMP family ABC transporter substrate-binding protein [Actinomycetota bacterium]